MAKNRLLMLRKPGLSHPVMQDIGGGRRIIAPRAYQSTVNGGGDTTPPTLLSAVVDAAGTTLTLTFDEAVTGNAGFYLTADDVAVALSGAANDGDEITFTCEQVYAGATLLLGYAEGNVADLADNDLVDFVDYATTNNSTVVALAFETNFSEYSDTDPIASFGYAAASLVATAVSGGDDPLGSGMCCQLVKTGAGNVHASMETNITPADNSEEWEVLTLKLVSQNGFHHGCGIADGDAGQVNEYNSFYGAAQHRTDTPDLRASGKGTSNASTAFAQALNTLLWQRATFASDGRIYVKQWVFGDNESTASEVDSALSYTLGQDDQITGYLMGSYTELGRLARMYYLAIRLGAGDPIPVPS